ncbi:hypothetical protein AGRA3207_000207 [Actinomadura graeca]|uniref:Uncharacterized protein n=1 Tax=Actinomadura graeca TaxID=2750812 RepID=A0ABX8QP23_9ACTN|nr:hypothetical protein [Actinomadura graeca]QXJ19644.1 hypothetical protein AGRA3207_000207 [Actinomadura graeca]
MNTCEFCRAGAPVLSGLPTCERCYSEVAATLSGLSELLAGLRAATPRTLARPPREMNAPGGSRAGPSSPAHEALLDLRAELIATVRTWAGLAGANPAAPPVRTLLANLAVALAVEGGASAAGRLLHLTDTARQRLDPPEVIQVQDRCPECGTRGLVRYDTGGPCWCSYCYAEIYPAA